MKRKLLFALGIGGVYIGLLLLLSMAESGSEGASINGFFPALWYSLVTMTTVGYGDMYPVTLTGKLIGLVFLLLSAGALTALIGLGVSWLNGNGLPGLRLTFLTGERYYVFDRDNGISRVLTESIVSEDSGAVCVLSSCEVSLPAEKRIICIKPDAAFALKLLAKKKGAVSIVLTDRTAENRLNPETLPDKVRVYCRTEHYTERSSPMISYFNPLSLCSSLYWQRNPLKSGEKKIVLIGFGALGRKLLEEVLVNSVFSPVQVREFLVFGDGEAFLLDHPALEDTVSVGKLSDNRDSVIFSDSPWNGSAAVLEADRILICSDNEDENVDCYGRLVTYFPVQAPVTLFSATERPGLPVFGSDRELFTAENVLRLATEKTARAMHEIYLKRVGDSVPLWDELSDFTRRSNLASAAHMGAKVRWLLEDDSITSFTPQLLTEAYSRFIKLSEREPELCRRIEHDRWTRFHSMYNWRFGEVRCNEKRLHPMLVPFEALDEENKAKDDTAWEAMLSLADYLRVNGDG